MGSGTCVAGRQQQVLCIQGYKVLAVLWAWIPCENLAFHYIWLLICLVHLMCPFLCWVVTIVVEPSEAINPKLQHLETCRRFQFGLRLVQNIYLIKIGGLAISRVGSIIQTGVGGENRYVNHRLETPVWKTL